MSNECTQYTRECTMTKEDKEDDAMPGCTCEEDCSLACECLLHYSYPIYDEKNRLISILNDDTMTPPIIECGRYCSCLNNCKNRVSQQLSTNYFEV